MHRPTSTSSCDVGAVQDNALNVAQPFSKRFGLVRPPGPQYSSYPQDTGSAFPFLPLHPSRRVPDEYCLNCLINLGSELIGRFGRKGRHLLA